MLIYSLEKQLLTYSDAEANWSCKYILLPLEATLPFENIISCISNFLFFFSHSSFILFYFIYLLIAFLC